MKKEIEIRRIKENEIDPVVDLFVRVKKLNNEFDSTFKVCENIQEEAKKVLKNIAKSEDHILLGAFKGKNIIGVMHTEILKRLYYDPRDEARIVEFYIMPEYRNKGIGKTMVSELYKILKAKNISLVTAEFPALNLIALNFYKKMEWREIVSVYGKTI